MPAHLPGEGEKQHADVKVRKPHADVKVRKPHGDDEGEKQHADVKVKKQHADAKVKKPRGDDEGKKQHEEDEDEGDQVISLEQVPDVARARILYEAGRNKLDKEIEKEKKDGKVFYEASWTEKGREVDIKVTADGKLVEKETKLPLAEAPKPVQATVRKVAGKTPVKEVEHVQAGKRVTYEAEWQTGDEKIEIEVAPDGKLLNRTVEKVKKQEKKKAKDEDDDEENEEEVTLDEVPAAVRATLLKAVGKNRIKEIEKETKDGRTIYEAGWKAGDQEIEIKVSPDGKVLSKKVEDDDEDGDDDDDDGDDDDDEDGDDDDDNGQKVTLNELPAAVRATLLKAAGRSRIEEIEKETEDGHIVFEAEWKAGGKKVEVKIAPSGKLLGKEVEDDDEDEDEEDDD